ncbi:MAG: hypothetical protein ABIO65_00030 [Nitrospiria bacterium]
MECRRCHGLMVSDRFTDLMDETGQMTFGGWRCLVCGEIVDPVIVTNRLNKDAVATKPRHPRLITWVSQSA